MDNKIKIIQAPSKENPFVIIYKPRNIPSAPLSDAETNSALYQTELLFPEIKNVCGKKQIEHGLVHRIDTVTDGLLLIATTQDAYDFFIKQQEQNNFIKYYKAECELMENFFDKVEGFSKNSIYEKIIKLKNNDELSFELKSFFRPFGKGRKEVRPVTLDSNKAALKKTGSKEYKTFITITKQNNTFFANCKITNGYRHQVRSHLAWCGLPIKNDPVYNPNFSNQDQFNFTAYKLEFVHPFTKEIVIVE